VLRNITERAASEGVDDEGTVNASREERNVAARIDFWSRVSFEVA